MPDRGLYRRAAALGLAFVVMAVSVSLMLRQGGQAAGSDLVPRALPSASSASSGEADGAEQAEQDGNQSSIPEDPAAQIAPLLAQRGASVLTKNRAAWQETISPAARAFRVRQGRVFGRLTALAPRSWAYSFRRATPLPASRSMQSGGWVAQVDLAYQLTAGGPTVHRHQYLTIIPAGHRSTSAAGTAGPGDWRIAGDTAGPTQSDLWDLSPISVTRGSRCLVIGSIEWRQLNRKITNSCQRSAVRVDSVWGRGWPRQTTLIVPDSQKQLGQLLDRSSTESKGLSDTAAVTVGPVSEAEEVLINPVVFTKFPALGIRVVLAHEMVHVATRATGSGDAPTWLAEGFADYVGFGDSGLGPRDIAGDALREVDRGRIPSAFPGDATFDSDGKGAAAAYGFAWTIMKTIANHGGTQRAVAFYRAATSGTGAASARVDGAVRKVLGLKDSQALVAEWRHELKILAG